MSKEERRAHGEHRRWWEIVQGGVIYCGVNGGGNVPGVGAGVIAG